MSKSQTESTEIINKLVKYVQVLGIEIENFDFSSSVKTVSGKHKNQKFLNISLKLKLSKEITD